MMVPGLITALEERGIGAERKSIYENFIAFHFAYFFRTPGKWYALRAYGFCFTTKF